MLLSFYRVSDESRLLKTIVSFLPQNLTAVQVPYLKTKRLSVYLELKICEIYRACLPKYINMLNLEALPNMSSGS